MAAGAVVAALGGTLVAAAPAPAWTAFAHAGDTIITGWQLTPYVAVAFLAGTVAVAFAVQLWRADRRPGSLALIVLAVGAALWSFFYGLELASQEFATKLLLSRLSYVGIVLVPPAWFAFALAYTGRGDRLTRRTVGLLLLPATVAAVLPWTSGASDLFWASTTLVTGGSVPMLALEYGPLFWLWSTYGYALLAGGTVLLLWSMPGGIRLFRAQTLLLLAGVLTPWLANFVYLFRLFGPGTLDLTPLGFVVSALALGGGFTRYRLLEVHPAARTFAREELVDRMAEGVLVLNDEGRIVDLNRAAQTTLGVQGTDVVGAVLGDVAPALADVIEGGRTEFTTGDPPRHYEVRVSSLTGGRTGVVGRLVTLADVTENRRRERRVAVLNRVLRHDLRNDVSVIQGYAKLLAEDPGNAEYTAIIGERAEEVLSLIGVVRDVERSLDAGGPAISPVDVVRVVDDQVDAARRSYPEAVIEVDLPAAERVRATDLLSSVIDNLVENAVEHSDREVPRVRVSVGRVVVEGQSYVEVRVADDGPGIPEPDREVLVGDAGLDAAAGLGLWLVNWLVTESGGEVLYEPNDPRGSVVIVRLRPAADASERDDDPRDWETLPTSTGGQAESEGRHPSWSATG